MEDELSSPLNESSILLASASSAENSSLRLSDAPQPRRRSSLNTSSYRLSSVRTSMHPTLSNFDGNLARQRSTSIFIGAKDAQLLEETYVLKKSIGILREIGSGNPLPIRKKLEENKLLRSEQKKL